MVKKNYIEINTETVSVRGYILRHFQICQGVIYLKDCQ